MEAINYFDMEQNAANVNILIVLHEQSIIFQKRDWILSHFLMPQFFLSFFLKTPFHHSCILLDIHFGFFCNRGSVSLIYSTTVIFYLNLPQDNYCSCTYAIRRD